MSRGTQLLLGFHAVTARLRHHSETVRELYVLAQRADPRMREVIRLAEEQGVRVIAVNAQRLDGMVAGARHQGVIARADALARHADLGDLVAGLHEPAFVLALDGVMDPHNLGACLRAADAMGAHAVVVPKDRSAAMTPTVVKVASGAADSMPLIPVTNLARAIQQLQALGVRVLGATGDAPDSLLAVDLRGPIAWVLGAEGQGLRRLTRERCDQLVRIPMFGQVESLNVSVAAALCLYETRRQRQPRE